MQVVSFDAATRRQCVPMNFNDSWTAARHPGLMRLMSAMAARSASSPRFFESCLQ